MRMKSWLATVVAAGLALAVPAAAFASAQLPHRGAEKIITSRTRAGYVALADKGTTFRFVAADLTLRSPDCHGLNGSEEEVFSQWVGLGGYNHSPVRQIGVSETCFGATQISFLAWYLDQNGQQSFFLSCSVPPGVCPRTFHPGDRIKLSVYYDGKSYRLRYVDVTKRASQNFDITCTACRSNSAEVITQGDYQAGGSRTPVHRLRVGFFRIQVTSAGGKHGTVAAQPGYWTSARIIMVGPGGHHLAVPSALLRLGHAFHVNVSGPVGCGCSGR